jgi:putative hemolysin
MKTITAFTASVLVVGCGSVSSVVSTGADTYMVASEGVVGNGSGATQKVAAFQAASSYCANRGAQLEVISFEQSEPFFGRAPSGQVAFRCEPK